LTHIRRRTRTPPTHPTSSQALRAAAWVLVLLVRVVQSVHQAGGQGEQVQERGAVGLGALVDAFGTCPDPAVSIDRMVKSYTEIMSSPKSGEYLV